MTAEASNQPSAPPPVRLLTEHFGLVVSMTLFFLVAFRILGVARFNLTTATAIVQTGGAANVALGSALASAGTAASLLLMYVFVRTIHTVSPIEGTRERGDRDYWKTAPLLWAVVFCIWLVAWWLLAFLTALFVLEWWRGRRARKKGRSGRSGIVLENVTAYERFAWLIGLVAMQVFTSSLIPWMPSERVQVGDESPFLGYVVSEQDGELVVLTSGADRQLVRYSADDVSRQLCSEERSWMTSPVMFLLDDDPYPDCPED